MEGFGEAKGEGEFYMPPRPEDPDQPWQSEPFNPVFQGELDVDGVNVIIEHRGTNNYVVLSGIDSGNVQMHVYGEYTITISAPAVGAVFSDTSGGLGHTIPIIFECHPECGR